MRRVYCVLCRRRLCTDFFGIKEFEDCSAKELIKHEVSRQPSQMNLEDAAHKYGLIYGLQKERATTVMTNYGIIRIDSVKNRQLPHLNEIHSDVGSYSSGKKNQSMTASVDHSQLSGANFIDSQYFDSISKESTREEKASQEPFVRTDNGYCSEEQDMSFIDSQYFGAEQPLAASTQSLFGSVKTSQSTSKRSLHLCTRNTMVTPRIGMVKSALAAKKPRERPAHDVSAFEAAMIMRKQMQKGASTRPVQVPIIPSDPLPPHKKFAALVPDYRFMPSELVAKELVKRRLLHSKHGVIAFNKPYALASQNGPGVDISVESLLPQLNKLLEAQIKEKCDLQLIHRLDKRTSGVMILAKDKAVAEQLSAAFRERRTVKRYLAITNGVPKLPEGVIDIPIVDRFCNGRYKQALVVGTPVDGAPRAVTRFKVVASNGSGALLLLHPLTGQKHQLRIHLGQALNCPIIGDHKYSYVSRQGPQRLYGDLLKHLGIRSTKVRFLPMTLHAWSFAIPQFLDGQNLVILAQPPPHFLRIMHLLKLKFDLNKHNL